MYSVAYSDGCGCSRERRMGLAGYTGGKNVVVENFVNQQLLMSSSIIIRWKKF